jgi:protein-tyrosine phosphatase
VGESSWLNKRINIHKSCTKNPKISPKSQRYLYNLFQQHDNIDIRILEETPNHKTQERIWIDYLNPLYNTL